MMIETAGVMMHTHKHSTRAVHIVVHDTTLRMRFTEHRHHQHSFIYKFIYVKVSRVQEIYLWVGVLYLICKCRCTTIQKFQKTAHYHISSSNIFIIMDIKNWTVSSGPSSNLFPPCFFGLPIPLVPLGWYCRSFRGMQFWSIRCKWLYHFDP